MGVKTLSNRDIQAAWQYHNSTKHSWHSVHTSAHYLDWNNQPMPIKVYPSLEGKKLPTDLPASGAPALAALAAPSPKVEKSVATQRDLAVLFYYAAGITKRGIVPGGQMYFRAAACTGALYHIELYLVCGDLPDLPAGVYHFGPHDFSLRRLREGDYRSVLVEASGQEPAVAQAPAVIVTTSVYWRNSWKYQSRAYRHSYWDSGTILANLLATGNAHRIPLKVVTAFVDQLVNRLLDLDEQREAALQLVPVGLAPGQSAPVAPEVTPLDLEVTPYSRREVDYPAIREMHAASIPGIPSRGPGPLGKPACYRAP
jgi:SagB-type dehydrogenase family enzyme